MKSKKPARGKRANLPVTVSSKAVENEIPSSISIEGKKSMAAPTLSPTAGNQATMFNNAQHVHITGGSFVNGTNDNRGNAQSLDLLYKRVAPNAILNAGGRADEVRCHPGTREEVIGRIEKWGDAQDDQAPPMFWLSGPAGAGKSAIMQTVAERCKEREVPQANFFFFREDLSRSHAAPLIATLVHQIILLYPSLRNQVATVLFTNPLIFDSTLEEQVEQLIVTPLRSIPQTYRPLLLLIDGLDECDSETKRSQEQILHTFDIISARYKKACPSRLLVVSRDESQIQVAFNKLSSQCLQLYLDETYFPESDIRVFVEAQFAEVRKTHRLAHMLNANWPSVNDIDYIVEKSSGHFVFAATVMRFISGSSASPVVSLERVRGITPLATKSPFLHLDAIYTYILSQVDDQDALKDILAVQLLLSATSDYCYALSDLAYYSTSFEEEIMGLLRGLNPRYSFETILSCLEDLTPLVKYDFQSGKLLFHHASFSDHLLDQARSREYFVDSAAFTYKILPQIWKDANHGHCRESWLVFSLGAINQLQRFPLDIMSLLTSSVKSTRTVIEGSPIFCRTIKNLFNLIFYIAQCINDDDLISYRCFLRECIKKDNFRKCPIHEIQAVPHGHRYYVMVYAQRYLWISAEKTATLRPESEFDRQELTPWLNELFDCIRNQSGHSESERRQYIEQWSSWADSNGIPFHDLDTQ